MSLEAIKARCHIDEITGCWEWRGATSNSNGGNTRQPRVHSVDYTADPTGNTKTVQTGNRAAWHAHTGKPIKAGHRVFKSACCTNGMCVNPEHLKCGTSAQWGKTVAAKKIWQGQPARIGANQAIARKKLSICADMLREIQSSEETGKDLAKRLGRTQSTVSRARRGELRSLATGNPFAGLMR